MLSSIFNFLYQLVCGENADSPEYAEGIFESTGLITLVIAFILAFIFYVALGRWRNVWHTRTHWVITIILSAAIGFGVAFSLAKNELGAVDGYLIRFAVFNMIYSIIYFILFSLLLKNFSIFSKRTPF